MKKEGKIFLTAVMFLTRLPVPGTIDHSPVYLQQARRYFPVVGWIVGALSALAFLVFSRYVSTDTGIVASMITGLFVTGAFHEDGFADVCDGFGGGWTREKILHIMKDSRIGAFGAIGLMAILSSKFVLLAALPGYAVDLAHPSSLVFYNYRSFILALILAHSVSRLMPVLVMQSGMNTSRAQNASSPSPAIPSITWPKRMKPGSEYSAWLPGGDWRGSRRQAASKSSRPAAPSKRRAYPGNPDAWASNMRRFTW